MPLRPTSLVVVRTTVKPVNGKFIYQCHYSLVHTPRKLRVFRVLTRWMRLLYGTYQLKKRVIDPVVGKLGRSHRASVKRRVREHSFFRMAAPGCAGSCGLRSRPGAAVASSCRPGDRAADAGAGRGQVASFPRQCRDHARPCGRDARLRRNLRSRLGPGDQPLVSAQRRPVGLRTVEVLYGHHRRE